MAVSLKQFNQQLTASGLISSGELAALLSDLPQERKADGEQLARELVRQKKLTAFQAQQIYAGRGKSLVLGNYVLLDRIGQGGMGMVLKAQHRRMKRVVALKVLSAAVTKSPAARARFQREVEAAAKLSHPNIVIAYDADQAGSMYFLVMEYVDGTDLSALVRENGPLQVAQAIDCILQAARGLQYAHSRGVVHRDIKPSNLLLDREGTIKILDMGLARLESAGADQDQLTGSGQIMGTIDFMAPEQAMDTRTADARADMYSLGATLWTLLTGRPLYEEDTVLKKILAHQNNPIPSLLQACPYASAALEQVVTRMLAKSPDARYGSMTDLIADLERCMGGSVEAPAVAAAPGEDTRLDAFLRKLDSPRGSGVGTKTAVKKAIALSPAMTPTVTFQSAYSDTDPQTQNLTASLLPARAAWPKAIRLPGRQVRNAAIAVAAAVSFLLVLAAVVIFIQSKDGVIRVQIDDPSIAVAIKGTNIVLKQADNGTDVKLAPGNKSLIVQRGDFRFETDMLILKKGDTTTVRVELLAGEIQVRRGDQVIGRAKLPREGATGRGGQPADPRTVQNGQPSNPTAGQNPTPPEAEKTGWQGWPADAPPPAIAPFDADQAKAHQEAWAKYLGAPVEYENSIGMKFALVPPGEFMMGSTPEEIDAALPMAGNNEILQDAFRSEAPRHKVVLTQPFYLGMHEVTQTQYERVTGTNPSQFTSSGPGRDLVADLDTRDHPVEMVSWNDAAEFCAKLSELEELKPCYFRSGNVVTLLNGNGYRLPTEAQWEFACRGGTTTRYWSGEKDEDLIQAGWSNSNSGRRTHAVGELKANPLGLFDVHGNVGEWCAEYYQEYAAGDAVDPVDPGSGDKRAVRGGSSMQFPFMSRSAARLAYPFLGRTPVIGFRIGLPVDAVKTALEKRDNQSDNADSSWRGWPADAPKAVPKITLIRYPSGVLSAAFSPDGRLLATAGVGAARVSNVESGGLRYALSVPRETRFTAVTFSPDGRYLLTAPERGSPDFPISIWEASTGEPAGTLVGHEKGLFDLSFSPDGNTLASCGWDRVVRLWDFSSRKMLREIPTPGGNWTRSVVFSSTGAIALGSDMVYLVDSEGKLLRTLGKGGPPMPLCFSPDGKRLAGTTWTAGLVAVWDVETGDEIAEWRAHARTANGVKFSPDGRLLVTAGGDGKVRFWDANTQRELAEVSHNKEAYAVAFSPDGKTLATTGYDQVVNLWDVDAVLDQQAKTAADYQPAARPADAPPPAIAPFDAKQAKAHQETWAKYLGVPVEKQVVLGQDEDGKDVKLDMVLVPPGEFLMGSTAEEHAKFLEAAKAANDGWGTERIPSEQPQHRVRITRPFRLSRYEVTIAQFRKFVNDTGYKTEGESSGIGGYGIINGQWAQDPRFVWNGDLAFPQEESNPVVYVTWNDATAYCEWLSRRETGLVFALPTEAQWEYACRAGTTTIWQCGDSESALQKIAWFAANAEGKPHPVGQLMPNRFGLHDMHGNVWEWCAEGYAADYYARSPQDDPTGPSADSFRVQRGGDWFYGAATCRSAYRHFGGPGDRSFSLGFRLAAALPEK